MRQRAPTICMNPAWFMIKKNDALNQQGHNKINSNLEKNCKETNSVYIL